MMRYCEKIKMSFSHSWEVQVVYSVFSLCCRFFPLMFDYVKPDWWLLLPPGKSNDISNEEVLNLHQITRLTTALFLMSSTSMLRIAARTQPSTFFRANGLRSVTPRRSNVVYAVPALIATSGSTSNFSTSSLRMSDKEEASHGHHEESFEEFTAR